jgi:translation initiation factor 1
LDRGGISREGNLRAMSRRDRGERKISTDSDLGFGSNPFSSLDSSGLPEALPESTREVKAIVKVEEQSLGNGERLEIRREKSGRGGKTVTTIRGIPAGLGKNKRDRLLKRLKNSLGTGGTWSGQDMELQGDRRAEIMEWMRAIGFRPVLAGG